MKTSTDYRRPYRPLAVSLFNRAGRLARKLGFADDLDVGRMIGAARRRTGLSDFGDEWFLEPLQVLVRSVNAEARLTSLGARIQASRIVSALSIRLRAEDLLRRHPEILDLRLGKIVLIAGLQRTATTTLQRLIAADPGIRALRSWEALNPVPLGGERRGRPRRRMREAKRAARALGWLAPDFLAIHPIAWDEPEEDIFLLDVSFMSQTPEAAMHVPSYSKWLEAQDHTKPYEYMRTLLKILAWQRPGDRWVLKTPHHMEHLDVILDVLPDVCVVQTHRDPKKSIPSFLSMVAHGRGILSDHVDPEVIGTHWMRKTLRMMERSMNVRSTADGAAFVDVSYYDLLAEPVGEVRRVYGAAGLEFTWEAEDAARAVSSRSVKDRHGRHVYAASSFGLDDATIDASCEVYRRTYRIPDEAAMRPGPSAEDRSPPPVRDGGW
ncbi:sulfotransferase family protein [Candidatus Palauibacter sp.]|uniref:sulfotransferase family protein n=1 Tax=Candidatus Palauibacter sp. TaxID=3101350 RepID=UPI003B01E215